jgi:hypothetical protein
VFIPERWIRDEKAGPRPDPVIPTKKGTWSRSRKARDSAWVWSR